MRYEIPANTKSNCVSLPTWELALFPPTLNSHLTDSWLPSRAVEHLHERPWRTLLSGVHYVFVALETECLCKFVSLVMFCLESTIEVVLFRHNLPQPTQAQLMRGELPETLCTEQGVMLSCRLAKWKVRWTSRALWMAVVSLSNDNSSRQE